MKARSFLPAVMAPVLAPFLAPFLALFLAASSISHALDDRPLAGLTALEWEKRVILVFSPDERVEALAGALHEAIAEVDDRRIAWFVFSDSQLRTNYPARLDSGFKHRLRSRYDSRSDISAQLALLIGYDGEIKRTDSKLDLRQIFSEIDRMPIRQMEMNAD